MHTVTFMSRYIIYIYAGYISEGKFLFNLPSLLPYPEKLPNSAKEDPFQHEAGSALNVNPHTHSLVPDGVFAFEPEQPVTFVELPAPTQRQLERLLATIVRRVTRAMQRSTELGDRDLDAELEGEPLAQAQAQAVQVRLEPTLSHQSSATPTPAQPLCARLQGFSLHAAVTVAASDKQGRLRLLRYGARPALSSQHLSLLPDGRVRYQLRRTSGPAGPQALTLQPTELLHRLAAILPRPYTHRTVYHGIFSPAANRRFEVTPAAARARRGTHRHGSAPLTPLAGPARPPTSTDRIYTLEPKQRDAALADTKAEVGQQGNADATPDVEAQAIARFCAPPSRPPGGRFPWAELIRRTFPDALDCPKCGGTLSVIAFITELAVVRKIIDHLGLPAGPTELAPARLPKELSFDFELDEHPSRQPEDTDPYAAAHVLRGRGPPAGDLDL
jgi:hypothetical protein